LLDAARTASRALARLEFPAPVAHVYDPHQYAWAPYEAYVTRYGVGYKRVVLGMNPGPFGMMQTGIPFGEIAAVRGWMGIHAPVHKPSSEHPKRPIEGFDCKRSEVSGRRLWGWAAQRFVTAEAFFTDWFVLNYCPLALLEASGRNFTPDKLPAVLLNAVYEACDRHLAAALTALNPEWAIGVGGFAEKRIHAVLEGNLVESALARKIRVGRSCIKPGQPSRQPRMDGSRREAAGTPRGAGLRARLIFLSNAALFLRLRALPTNSPFVLSVGRAARGVEGSGPTQLHASRQSSCLLVGWSI
jgi:single-strand selective monofunctional uracil DNA glycosylase